MKASLKISLNIATTFPEITTLVIPQTSTHVQILASPDCHFYI